jgi:hypothetical protein
MASMSNRPDAQPDLGKDRRSAASSEASACSTLNRMSLKSTISPCPAGGAGNRPRGRRRMDDPINPALFQRPDQAEAIVRDVRACVTLAR